MWLLVVTVLVKPLILSASLPIFAGVKLAGLIRRKVVETRCGRTSWSCWSDGWCSGLELFPSGKAGGSGGEGGRAVYEEPTRFHQRAVS